MYLLYTSDNLKQEKDHLLHRVTGNRNVLNAMQDTGPEEKAPREPSMDRKRLRAQGSEQESFNIKHGT